MKRLFKRLHNAFVGDEYTALEAWPFYGFLIISVIMFVFLIGVYVDLITM